MLHPKTRQKLSAAARGLFVAVLMFATLFPFYWTLLISLKTQNDAFQVPPDLLFVPTLENYSELFVTGDFTKYFFNSFVVCFFSIVLALLVGIPSAYIFARSEFRGKKAFFYVLLITRMSPGAVFVIPYFLAYNKLGMLDTYVGLTLIYFASNLGIIVWSLRAFMEDIPVSLEEAARIDGCSLLQSLFKIAIPLSTPGIASTAILSFIFSWNEFLFALLLTRQKVQTAPIGILNFIVFERMNWGVIAAGSIVIALPVVVFGIAIRKYYVKGLTQGGLAGE
ncbi:carbohydrate ABC transporter permease [Ruthenibacterium sp. CLA-JM-H11]|uniref:Carbohydrate ABC transporter permease n=1 Tax=Ruthenibacterium intestinale TaxID=3133163 RepID=A0ABV1GDK3_9FIRM